jgi:asparagine synthase (glutamine-hydrolysing)
MDEPTVDGVNTYFIARAARNVGLTVVLSGTGGDEVFLGYNYFRKARMVERLVHTLRMLPGGVRRRLISAGTLGGGWLRQFGVEKVRYLDQPVAEHAYLLFRGLYGPREIVELLGIEERELESLGPLVPDAACTHVASLFDCFTLLEFQHYLQNQLLKDTDVMSMAHSVEVRVPYLDHGLVEYVLGLPQPLKFDGSRPKPLLVGALGEDLPREVWDRPKMGFTFPFDTWLRQQSDELESYCLESKLLRRNAVVDMWQRFRARRVHWSRVWALVVFSRFEAGRQGRLRA